MPITLSLTDADRAMFANDLNNSKSKAYVTLLKILKHHLSDIHTKSKWSLCAGFGYDNQDRRRQADKQLQVFIEYIDSTEQRKHLYGMDLMRAMYQAKRMSQCLNCMLELAGIDTVDGVTEDMVKTLRRNVVTITASKVQLYNN